MHVLSYPSQCYSGSSQPNESSIAGMWSVYGIGVVVTELVHNLGDAVVVVVGQCIANGRLESAVLVSELSCLRLTQLDDGW
jgi:hypothetical protein